MSYEELLIAFCQLPISFCQLPTLPNRKKEKLNDTYCF